MKKKNVLIVTLLCLSSLHGMAQDDLPFHGIRNGEIRQVANEQKTAQKNNEENAETKDDLQIDDYSVLSIEQLEDFIAQIEAIREKRNSRHRKTDGYEKVYKYYEGDDHNLNIYSLMEVMEEVGLSNQLFVLAQAVVETGHFKSHVCQEYNNLFGLRNPRTHSYYRFSRWEDSVIGYLKFVQYKYKGGNYLSFLKRIGYAESPYYVQTVAKVARQLYKQLKAEGRLS